MIHLIEMLILNVILLAAISWLSQSDHDHDNGGVQWKYTSSRIPRFNWDVSKHNPYLYYPSRLLPILGYSDIPLVGGSRLSLLTIIILSHFYWRTQFPVTNPIKHGRNYFVRRLHYAAGEVRSYTLYFPMHRTLPLVWRAPAIARQRPPLAAERWDREDVPRVPLTLGYR